MNGLTLNTSMIVGDAMVRGFVEGVSVRRHEARLLGRGALALSRRFASRSIGHGPLVPVFGESRLLRTQIPRELRARRDEK